MATRDTIQYPSSQHSSIMLGFSFSVHKPVVKGKGMDHINLKSNQGKSLGAYYNCQDFRSQLRAAQKFVPLKKKSKIEINNWINLNSWSTQETKEFHNKTKYIEILSFSGKSEKYLKLHALFVLKVMVNSFNSFGLPVKCYFLSVPLLHSFLILILHS